MLTRNALLPEYRDFLASIDPNVYPTFNFGYPVSIEVGQGSLVHFFNRLQRQGCSTLFIESVEQHGRGILSDG
jgi:hypothetical protein